MTEFFKDSNETLEKTTKPGLIKRVQACQTEIARLETLLKHKERDNWEAWRIKQVLLASGVIDEDTFKFAEDLVFESRKVVKQP